MRAIALVAWLAACVGLATAQQKPNILVIFGDDIGYWNISANNPKNPQFRAMFGPRGVLKCVATDMDDPTVDQRFGRMGKQKCEDTGPLSTKRMETVDEEFLGAAMNFIDRQHKAKKPFFVWFNSTRMHIYTHLKPIPTI